MKLAFSFPLEQPEVKCEKLNINAFYIGKRKNDYAEKFHTNQIKQAISYFIIKVERSFQKRLQKTILMI